MFREAERSSPDHVLRRSTELYGKRKALSSSLKEARHLAQNLRCTESMRQAGERVALWKATCTLHVLAL